MTTYLLSVQSFFIITYLYYTSDLHIHLFIYLLFFGFFLCYFFTELYVAQNKLRKIEGLEGLSKLRILDLGANRIRVRNAFIHLFM